MKTYKYVDGEYEIKTEIKRSVFIASVKGEVDEKQAEEFVKSIRKKYPDATHNCYAYVADELGNVTRFSDDGEPSGTAGQPILDVIRKQGLVKTAIVVTRYFGGIKLGAGGLVGAYSQTAASGVAMGKISVKTECVALEISADYPTFAILEKFIRKGDAIIGDITYFDTVRCRVFVKTDDVKEFADKICELSAARARVEILDEKRFEKVAQ